MVAEGFPALVCGSPCPGEEAGHDVANWWRRSGGDVRLMERSLSTGSAAWSCLIRKIVLEAR